MVSVLACDRVSRIRQCAGLVDAVNGSMRGIGLAAGNESLEQGLVSNADRYVALAQQLGPMEFNDKQMALDVEAFRRLLMRAAELCEKLRAAVQSNERAQAALLGRELEALEGPMKASAHKMNTWCQER